MKQLTNESIAQSISELDYRLMQRNVKIEEIKGTALKDLNGRVMPRLLRKIWLDLGKKNNRNTSVLGWKSDNEERFLIPHDRLSNLKLGMDVSYYLDNQLVALIEAKSNYPMGIEKTILDTPYLKRIQPNLPHIFVSVTGLSTKNTSKDRINKIFAEDAGVELWDWTGKIRSQFDQRWYKKLRIPPQGIVPFIDRIERLMND